LTTFLIAGLVVASFGIKPAAADFLGHAGMVRSLAISPDGTRVLSGGFDYTARLWDFGSQQELRDLEARGPVNAVAFLPDGDKVLTAGDDGVVTLWDVNTGNVVRRYGGHGLKVVDIAVSADGRLIASAGWDHTILVWETATGHELRRILHPSDANAIAFDANADMLYSGHKDGALRLWRVSDGRLMDELPGHVMAITSIALSPAGDRLLTAGIDGSIRLWDVADREELRHIDAHDGPVFDVSFSPDGTRALSGGRDGHLRLWSLVTGRLVRDIIAHEKPLWSVAFTPDSRFALSSSSDESIRVWHLGTGDRIGVTQEQVVAERPQPWLHSDDPGAAVYRKCAFCHALDADGPQRSGPHLAGLFGRRVGAVPGYHYSRALRNADFTWDTRTLHELFANGPDVMLPGTKMPIQRIPDADKLDALINYLQRITATR
jgi:cytochrome c